MAIGLHTLDILDEWHDVLDFQDLGDPNKLVTEKGPWKPITDLHEISKHIAQQNTMQFNQPNTSEPGNSQKQSAAAGTRKLPTKSWQEKISKKIWKTY